MNRGINMSDKKRKRKIIDRILRWTIGSATFIFLGIVLTFCIITYNIKYTMPQITNIELYDSSGVKYLSYSNNKKQAMVNIFPFCIEFLIAL